MKILVFATMLAGTFAAISGIAADTPAGGPRPASEASVKELMTVMHSKKLTDDVLKQMTSMMQSSVHQALSGQSITPEKQKTIDEALAKMQATIESVVSWDKFEPMMIDVYEKSFSQPEVDGMLKFYKSPSGQAVLSKMPLVMQNTMQAVQGQMAAIMPQVQAMQRDLVAKLKDPPPP